MTCNIPKLVKYIYLFSLPHLQKGALENTFDMIIHVGDFAYDMYEDNGSRGDVFMEQIEPIASKIPYMTCPGNSFVEAL